jgi:L-ascorbate metabolism protein UlaG (beta-lactamase superfamily)
MNKIKADIVFVPVGGTYTMNATEAAKMVNTIKPGIAIPIHFGTISGNLSDAQDFKAQAEVEVKILPASK